MELFLEISLLIGVAVLISIMMKLLKQPLIIGYIITGIITGPHLLNIVNSAEMISIFSQMGVALLLFIVGLNLSPKVIKEVGLVSLVTGCGQVLFTCIIGFGISNLLGFSIIESAYISIALAFSSTIIIMKLLSDKGDTQKLYGKIAIGFLIVQDLIAIAVLMVISSLSHGMNLTNFAVKTLSWGFGLITLLFLAGIYILPKTTRLIAKSQEILLLFSIGWALLLSSLFYYLNFSMEIGALLAGITLSMSPYRYEISCKLRPIRDFFIVLFFILLGYQLGFQSINYALFPVILFSLFVLIGNPIIVMSLMGLLGYTKRNGFLAGLTVAQISEFSFILVALGVKLGHLSDKILSYITFVGLLTIAGSSYMIMYSNKIYPHLSKCLALFERKGKKVDEHKYHKDGVYDIVLFGYNSIGFDLLKSFKKLKKRFLVVDHNPGAIISLAKEGVDCRYGDVSDAELLGELSLSKAKLLVSTISDFDTNLFLINKIKELNKKAIIVVVSQQIDEAIELYKRGASYIIMPHFLGGYHASTLIEKHGLNFNKFLKEKIGHLEHLKVRKEKGHEHPKREG
ncbi:cation:proton antiporter [Candidatus Woesearchaeota archaeon]|nr:cation:proton antiporter [Candidatus Woesearchaeota archaeon]